MKICFNGLQVISASSFAKGKNLARTVLYSESADITATLPYKYDKNIFNPRAGERYSVQILTEGCCHKKGLIDGVILKLLVNAYAIENNLEEGSTRVLLSLTDEMGDYKNENTSYSEIEANWSEDSEKDNEVLENLSIGKTLYVLIQAEN